MEIRLMLFVLAIAVITLIVIIIACITHEPPCKIHGTPLESYPVPKLGTMDIGYDNVDWCRKCAEEGQDEYHARYFDIKPVKNPAPAQ